MSRRATRSLRALRALLRLEVRQWRRHGGRSLLMLLLVALPVAAMVGGTGLFHITEAEPEENARQQLGSADLRIEGVNPWQDLERALNLLPQGSTTTWGFTGMERVSVPGRRLPASLLALPPQAIESAPQGKGSLARGMVHFVDGRAPRHAGEVALSPTLLNALDRKLGEKVTLEYGAEREITGVVVSPEDLQLPLVLRTPASSEHPGRRFLLAELAAGNTAAGVAESLRQADFDAVTRAEAATGDEAGTALVFALGSLGLFEAALVISAAFGVSLRRRQVEIGLLAAGGAAGRQLLRSLLISVALLAIIGGLIGSAVAIAAMALIHPFLDGWTHRMCGPFEIIPWHVFGAISLGTMAAVAAALLPARGAVRLPIRQALAGRRPTAEASRKGLLLGILCVTAGVGLMGFAGHEDSGIKALGVVLGPIFSIVGFGISSPALLQWGAGKAAALPLAWRLAVRDAGRFRERNGAVVTAVLAGMAMSVTLAALVASLDQAMDAFPRILRTDQLLIEGPGAEQAALGVAESLVTRAAVPLPAAYFHGEPLRGKLDGKSSRRRNPWIAVGDEELLTAMGAEAGRQDFLDGKMLILDADSEEALITFHSWVSDRLVKTPAVSRIATDQRVREPVFLLHESALAQYGLELGPPPRGSLVPWLLRLGGSVTRDDLELARAQAAQSARADVDAHLLHDNKFRSFYHWVLLVCVLTGVLIVVTATALSAAESAADERVLHTLGAAPTTLRRHQAARAGYLALLGCLLAVPGGLLAAGALAGAVNFPLDFVIPWRDIAVVVVGLPALIYAGTWLLTRPTRRLPKSVAAAGVVILLSMTAATAPSAAAESGIRPSSVAPIQKPTPTWEPYQGEAVDGSPLVGELGRLTVPEHHDRPEGSTIDLAFVRYRTSRPDAGAPIFYLAGGPGGSGIEGGAVVATHPQIRLLQHRDVIAIDQRGTGKTEPNLMTEPVDSDFPLDRPLDRQSYVAALQDSARRTVEHWRRLGVDLNAYNTEQSAHDLDAVRHALGYDKIVLYGTSYGSHLGLAYLRYYSHHVERAVLSKVEGPNHTHKLPSTVQEHLDHLHRRMAEHPAWQHRLPDLKGTISQLLTGLANQPVITQGLESEDGDRGPAVTLGPLDLQIALSRSLASATQIAELPAHLTRALEGDWSALAAGAREDRRLGLPAMSLMMDCASGADGQRLQRLKQEAQDPDNLLSDAILAPFYPEVCLAAGNPDVGDDFRGPLHSEAPVLFVSGSLDVRTPPGNVQELLEGFPNAVHVTVENAGHQGREHMSPEFRGLLQAFLRGEAVESCTITLPKPLLKTQLEDD